MKRNRLRSIVILLTGLALLGAGGCRRAKPENENAARAVKVTTARLSERVFRNGVPVQGTVQAKNSARMAALAPGTIEELFVDEGTRVSKGQALFQTDKLNLENKVQIERDNLKVAAASRAEAEAGLREAEATVHKAELDFRRFKKMYEEEKAVTLDAYERTETAYKRADAGLAHARAVVDLAVAGEAQARSSLKIAEKQLADSLVAAPFDGVVTRKFFDRGEFAGAGTVVLTLDEPSLLEVAFVLSADYYDKVLSEKTRILFSIPGREPETAGIYYKSPSVHPLIRTFECKAYLPSTSGFAPGMLCDVVVILDEHNGLGIPNSAIGIRGGEPVVFTADNDRAAAHPIISGLSDDGITELLKAESLRDKDIIVEGQAFLNDGDPIRVK